MDSPLVVSIPVAKAAWRRTCIIVEAAKTRRKLFLTWVIYIHLYQSIKSLQICAVQANIYLTKHMKL
jgi:hypothetical protein